jgi:hypothetical protein
MKPSAPQHEPGDEVVKARMEAICGDARWLRAHLGCEDDRGGQACALAGEIVENGEFRRDLVRLLLSALEDDGAVERLWQRLSSQLAANRRPYIDAKVLESCAIRRSAEWFVYRRRSQAGWGYPESVWLTKVVGKLLFGAAEVARTEGEQRERMRSAFGERVNEWRDAQRALGALVPRPYRHCEEICREVGQRCLYRYAVEDVAERSDFVRWWHEALPLAETSKEKAWGACERVAQQLVEWASPQEEAGRRIGLCFGQKMLLSVGGTVVPEVLDDVFSALAKEAAKRTAEEKAVGGEMPEQEGDNGNDAGANAAQASS